MPLEIERKFLVKESFSPLLALHQSVIKQYYLPSEEEGTTLRLRIIDGQARITRKGLSSSDGLVRSEEERAASAEEVRLWLEGPILGVIEKVRYYVPHEDNVWEVDRFLGKLTGFTMAEIELTSPDQQVSIPTWIGREVTGDVRYYNSALALMESLTPDMIQ